MTWIILEGIDRSGKSSVADLYKKKGFEVLHMSAPDKKYTDPGYAGPSYLDEIVDMYLKYDNRDVVFDRSPYGEAIWPYVYGRDSQLTDEDFEILGELETRNEVERVILYDKDVAAHWKRCVDNHEPLTKSQFNNATTLYNRLSQKFSFTLKTLADYNPALFTTESPQANNAVETTDNNTAMVASTTSTSNSSSKDHTELKSTEQIKLEKANAINQILSKPILRQKGDMFDELEKDVRVFLNAKLADIFGNGKNDGFTKDEVQVLKTFCARLAQKEIDANKPQPQVTQQRPAPRRQ